MNSVKNGLALLLLMSATVFAQKPAWVENPGTYASDNFVAVGVAKDGKVDKAKAKAEKKAKDGITNLLSSKYAKKDIKAAMASLKMQSYWQDPMTSYYYVLALLPFEAIDKDYKAQKQAEKTKSSAMGALKMLNAMTKDPDVIVVKVDMDNEDNSGAVSKSDDSGMETSKETVSANTVTATDQPKKDEGKKEEVVKDNTTMSVAVSTVSGGTQVSDFKNKSFGNFKWVDQDQNSRYSFLGDGFLSANVVENEWFDPHKGEKMAPRIEIADLTGDFTIEAKVKMDWEKYRAGFGLVVHNGKQNIRTYVLYSGSYVYLEGYANDIEVPRTEKNIEKFKNFGFLKLVHKGYTFTSYYSSIADDWTEIASFESEFSSTFSVGLMLLNSEGTTVPMKVDYVKISQ